MKNIVISGLLLLGVVAPMKGVVAKPGLLEAKQPDGSTVFVRMEGGPRGHSVYDADDQLLMNDDKGFYVTADESFKTKSEKRTLEKAGLPNNRIVSFAGPGLMKNPFPSTGSQKALIILVEFPDCKFTIPNPKQYYNEMLNGDDFTKDEATGSAKKYFKENSNNAFDISFDIYGPVTVNQELKYYGGNDYYGEDLRPHEMIIEACQILNEDYGVDFSNYDKNNDGEIDIVYVFYAGYGEADGGGPNTIWPHSFEVKEGFGISKYFNNKLLNHYACSNELQYSSPQHTRPDGIGTFCHEFCHVLGLPDIYSTLGGGAFTPGDWTLLDSGSYNNNSRTPPFLSSFERYALGWLEPTELNNSGSFVLDHLGESNSAFIIKTETKDEYFLLENRQLKGWDQYLPGHGMVVWHIDYYDYYWNKNIVNTDASHQRIDLVEADGIPSNWTRDGDAFPGLYEKTMFTPYTKPALISWRNKSLGIGIREIQETSDGKITFKTGDLLGVKLNKANLTLHATETSQLEVSFDPKDSSQTEVLWKSEDPAVADVNSSGLISAQKRGSTKIIVSSAIYPELSAFCMVDVVPYSVKYYVDGKLYVTGYYDVGETINAIKPPQKEGHSFIQWEGLPEIMPAKDISVTAFFELNSYNITFLVDGEEYQTLTYEYGSSISLPPAPSKEGYTFTGWSGLPATMPAEDIKVDATFEVNSYILSYYVDGELYNQQTLEYGCRIIPLSQPAKNGYTFTGWSDLPETMPAENVDVNGSFIINSHTVYFYVDGSLYYTSTINFGDKITLPKQPEKEGNTFTGWSGLPDTMPDEDVTTYATFDANVYKLTYYLDNEIYNEGEWAFGEKVQPLEAPVKKGYTFSGWTGVPDIMPAKNVEVYGFMTINSHTVTFMFYGKIYHSAKFDYGSVILLPEDPVKTGYTFTGWSNLPDTMPDEDIILNALFEINSYVITYYLDGELYNKQSWNYGSEIRPLSDPEKQGHTFSGWKGLPNTMPAENIDVYGSFNINSHSVKFIVDGEEYHSAEFNYGSNILLPADPEKEGHTFVGWRDLPETMPDYDITIVADFKVNSYELTYYLDGLEYNKQICEFGSKITPLKDPDKEGYTFSGWLNVPESMPANNVDIRGFFSINSYNVYYYVDGSLYYVQSLEYGSIITPPEVIPEEGRIFNGWETPIPEKMPANDLSIYGSTILDESGVSYLEDFDGKLCDIYTLSGILIHRKINISDLKDRIQPGVYLLKQGNNTNRIIVK